MFNFFKTKEPEIPVYVPKINDMVKHKDFGDVFLVTSVIDDVVVMMDPNGVLISCEPRDITQVSRWGRGLSEIQGDRYYNRTPEQILRRKINQRLKHLVTEDELAIYHKVDTIRNLIKGDLTK